MLHHHGNLLKFVQDVARRFGWNAYAENVGVEPVYLESNDPMRQPIHLYDKQDPPRGDIVLERVSTGEKVDFDYGLPEEEDEIRDVILEVIQSRDLEDKSRGKMDRSKPFAPFNPVDG